MRWWASAPRRDTDLDMGVPGPGGLVVMENGQVGEGEVQSLPRFLFPPTHPLCYLFPSPFIPKVECSDFPDFTLPYINN